MIMMKRIAQAVLLLSCCCMAASSLAADCAASGCTDASQATAAPSSRLSAQQLVRLHGVNRLSQSQLEAIATSTASQLERQALRQLDPDNQLSSESLHTLSLTLASDIRPVVRQAIRSINPATLSAALSSSYQQQLSASQQARLLAYYRSTSGQHYLKFSQELDQIVADGLIRISHQSFSFNRAQQAGDSIRQQRLGLLSMSSIARQLQAGNNHSSATLGLAMDLFASQGGAQLDRLAQRYHSELAGFSRFQHSDEAIGEARAQALWGKDSATLFAPALERAKQQLASRQSVWQKQAATLRARAASGAQ